MAQRYREKVSIEELREVFVYDEVCGGLLRRWKSGKLSRPLSHQNGILKSTKYHTVTVRCNTYMLHVVTWAVVHGEWPSDEVDHIDGNKTNNRITNLRVVTHELNTQNRRAPSSTNKASGLQGVCSHYTGRWQARLSYKGRNLHLGTFDTPEAAHAAYLETKRRLHPGCTI